MTITPDCRPSDLLLAGKALIADPKHWGKGSFIEKNEDGEDCYCAVGALNVASSEAENIVGIHAINGLYDGARLMLQLEMLEIDSEQRFYSIYHYNDVPERTHSEIMSLYDSAIARAKKHE